MLPLLKLMHFVVW